MTSVEAKLRSIISKLEDSLEDAAKVDKGKAGQPGTRLRKAAKVAQDDLAALKKMVLEARKSD
jgi:hypothetical protein